MSADNDDMVERDLAGRGIRDERVLAAFRKVDRKAFVQAIDFPSAYSDKPLPLTHGQTISQPFMVATMLEPLRLGGSEKVLEIGTGSGYQTALLAELAREVYTVERIEYLATTAEDRLEELGYTNIRFKLGDGSLGWSEHQPYDRIVVSAACPHIPQALAEQLAEGGIMTIPAGNDQGQTMYVCTKKGGKIESQPHTECVFVPLIGEQAFRREPREGSER